MIINHVAQENISILPSAMHRIEALSGLLKKARQISRPFWPPDACCVRSRLSRAVSTSYRHERKSPRAQLLQRSLRHTSTSLVHSTMRSAPGAMFEAVMLLKPLQHTRLSTTNGVKDSDKATLYSILPPVVADSLVIQRGAHLRALARAPQIGSSRFNSVSVVKSTQSSLLSSR